MLDWKKHKLESGLPGEISITSDMQMAENEEELKSLLMKVKEETEKVWHLVPSLHGIDGETEEAVADFIFGGFKITVDGDCSHEIKRCLLLARKVMTNLDSILKSRDITMPTKVLLAKSTVFPVVM